MKHFLFFMGLGCSIAANASAAEPKPNTPTAKPSPVVGEPVETLLKSNTVAVDLKPVPVTGRKQLEALLLQPAKLDFGERKSASVKEILQQLREKHHLSIRFDLPTLAALFGIDAVHQQLEHKVAPVAQMSGGIIDLKKTKSRYQDPGYHPPMGPLPPRYLPDSNEVESLPSVLVSEDSAPAAASPGASPVPTPVKAAKAPVTVAPVSAPAPFIKLLRMVSEEKSGKEAVATVTADLSEPEAATTEKQDDATPKEMPQAEEVEADESASETETPASGPTTLETFLNLEVNLETIDLQNLTIATALRQTLDSVPSLIAADVIGIQLPVLITNGCLPDYLVEEDGLLITTRMTALSRKETRVYSVKQFKDLKAEELAKVIRQSVRPWSWRSTVNDLGDQLRGSIHIPAGALESLVKTGMQLASAELGGVISVSDSQTEEGEKKNSEKDAKAEAQEMAALGNAMANSAVTLAHASLTGIEMLHYAEFPLGTIQTLPGKLVITQSQAAHREISELLKQLAEE